MKSDYIYTITAMGGQYEDTTGAWIKNRLWGWYAQFDDAHSAVINNAADMNESGSYNYIVIEKVDEGVVPLDTATWWYKFNHKTHKYEKIESPKWAEGIVNWSMG